MANRKNRSLELLYQSKDQTLYTLAYRLIKSPEAADDLVHDAFCLTVPLQEVLTSAAAAQHTSIAEVFPRNLSAQDHQILLWRFESQLPYTEIALRLHISESGVRSRAARAVARCRLLLKETNFLDGTF